MDATGGQRAQISDTLGGKLNAMNVAKEMHVYKIQYSYNRTEV